MFKGATVTSLKFEEDLSVISGEKVWRIFLGVKPLNGKETVNCLSFVSQNGEFPAPLIAYMLHTVAQRLEE